MAEYEPVEHDVVVNHQIRGCGLAGIFCGTANKEVNTTHFHTFAKLPAPHTASGGRIGVRDILQALTCRGEGLFALWYSAA